MTDFNNQAHQRSRSHQNDVVILDRAALRDTGRPDARPNVARANIPDGHLVGGPPKTANEGQQRPTRQNNMIPNDLELHDASLADD